MQAMASDLNTISIDVEPFAAIKEASHQRHCSDATTSLFGNSFETSNNCENQFILKRTNKPLLPSRLGLFLPQSKSIGKHPTLP